MIRVGLAIAVMVGMVGAWHTFAQVPQTGAGLGAASTPAPSPQGQPCVLVNSAFECQQANLPLTTVQTF